MAKLTLSMRELFVNKPVVLCVGTVNVLGDSLGPKVGDRLVEKFNVDAYVYGRTARPVNGLNYLTYVEHIKRHHPDSIVIAVDACLGSKEDVGRVKYTAKGLRAGAALNKKLMTFGDLGILGVVAEKGKDNLLSLINADKNVVDTVADKAAERVSKIVENLRLNYKFKNKISLPN